MTKTDLGALAQETFYSTKLYGFGVPDDALFSFDDKRGGMVFRFRWLGNDLEGGHPTAGGPTADSVKLDATTLAERCIVTKILVVAQHHGLIIPKEEA